MTNMVHLPSGDISSGDQFSKIYAQIVLKAKIIIMIKGDKVIDLIGHRVYGDTSRAKVKIM